MTLRTVDLFAGCGGLSLGFQKEKYNIVAAFELWDAAVKCYKEKFFAFSIPNRFVEC